MNKKKEIAILGAGIGGLTTAIALRQKGFENIRIYERRHTATTIGGGIVIWANASKVFTALNLINEIEQVGGSINEMQRWAENGEFIGSISINDIDSKIGAKSYSINRNDLQEILLQKIRELNIAINYNHNALQISTQKSTAFINFGNGIKVNADIIVGADGRMNSIARKHVNNDNSPVYQNFVNWISIVESDKPIFNENNILDFWGCGERFGIVPINKHKGYWAGGKSLPINSATKNENHKSYLLKQFQNWPNEIKNIIELSNEENIRYIEVFDHNPIKRWYKNNVCLLGDAAHAALPTSGQGACQAIEDAWHFATVLAESSNIEHAYNEYNNDRLGKTTKIIMAGRQLAQSIFNENRAFCEQRSELARNMDYKKRPKTLRNYGHKSEKPLHNRVDGSDSH